MLQLYEDKEWLFHQYVVCKKTAKDIAIICGCSSTPIFNRLHKYGIAVRTLSEINTKYKVDTDWLRENYITKKRSVNDISQEIGVCNTTLYKKLKRAGIEIRERVYVSGKSSRYFKGFEGISGTFWYKVERTAIRRSIEFNIDLEYAWGLFIKQEGRCALTGLELSYENSACTASLDRINSAAGYVRGNVQWVHKHINMMKGSHDQKYFVKLCGLVSNNMLITSFRFKNNRKLS